MRCPYQAPAYVEGSVRVDVARPFLRLAGGISGSDATTGGPTDTQLVLGTFAAYLGAHFFVDPAFSISPHLGVEYEAGGGSSRVGAVTMPLAYDCVQVFVGVELLGWIGGERAMGAR